MKGIYGNKIILLFMVYQSCGHDRQREYGLNVNAMYVVHGGSQHIMYNFKMTKHA